MKNTLIKHFENPLLSIDFKSVCIVFTLLVMVFPSTKIYSQCGSEPFPDQWVVHQLQSSELPYRSVYIYANKDIDGDGRNDIVTGGWWYKNPGTAGGNWVRSTIGGSFKNMAYIHDFDGDGDQDLLGTTGAYTGSDLVWAQNNGSGNFTIRTNIPSGDTNFSEPFLAGIAGANFQSGGPFQMAINWNGAESTGSPVQMLTVPSNPVSTTWPLVDISSSSLGEDLQAGDIDDDGDLDLFQSKNWLRNEGNGNWTTINIGIDYPTTPDRAQLADFDGDGDLDAVVGQLSLPSNTSGGREFSWFEAPSNPTQNWTRHLLATDINGSLSVYAEDIDQDGDPDIVVGEWRGSKRLIAFENDLCDSGDWIRHTLNAGGNFDHHDGARVVDIDDDGDFDVVSIGWDNIVPRIFENTSTTSNNQDPLANAGANQSITLPTNSITLNGSGSDPDGGTVSFAWTQTSGPNTATLANETTSDLTTSGLVEGTYVFRLTVTDDENDTAFDEVSVTVNPEANSDVPLANAGADQSMTLPTNSITLNGTGSDPDGGTVSFAWTQTSGPNTATISNEDTADLMTSGLIEGTYVFRLTVTDDENDTAFDEVSVTVNPEANTDIPMANAGADQSITLPTNSITLNGSGSDPDGGTVSFAWTQTSGPNTASLSNEDTTDVTASGLIEGTYVFRLTVTDDENDTAFDEVSVTVNPEANTDIPLANAGADQNITLPTNSITLNGSGSDPDGGTVSFAWTQTNGPNTAALSNEDTADLTTSGLVEGTYVFRLTVTDDENDTAFDEVSVTVNPEANTDIPMANTGADQNITLPINSITLNGTGSDPDGGTVSFAWTQTSGPNTATLANETTSDLTTSGLVEGTYVFRLTVTDDENDTAFDEVSVTVNPEANTDIPLANVGADQSITLPTNSITLNGSGSDPDGGTVSFAWTQTSGPNTATLANETTSDLTTTGLIEGTYIFRLTVTDDENDTAFDEINVIVLPEGNTNQVPVAVAEATPLNGEAPLEVSFTAANSTDDDQISSYSWDFGNGDTATGATTDYTFEASGMFTVELTVTDSEGLTNTTSLTITVIEPELVEQETGVILEVNPSKEFARLLLVNQAEEVQVTKLLLHDSTGRLVTIYDVDEVRVHSGMYALPIADLSNEAYYLSISLNNGIEQALVLIVRN